MFNLFRALFFVMCGLFIVSAAAFVAINIQDQTVRKMGLQNVSDCLSAHGVYLKCSGSFIGKCEEYRQTKWAGVYLPRTVEALFVHDEPNEAYWFFPPDKISNYNQRPYAVAKTGGCLP